MNRRSRPAFGHTDYAIGEVESLVLKAYRATGMPWGLAEEAGKAAGWLAMHELPAIEAFAGLVARFDGIDYKQRAPADLNDLWHAPASELAELCPVVVGVCIADFSRSHVTTGPLAYPIICLPFVQRTSHRLGQRLLVQFEKLQVLCAPEGITLEGDPSALGTELTNKFSVEPTELIAAIRPGNHPRAKAHPMAIEQLEAMAFRTYVPETAESRARGAGAGEIDND